jgi:CheY-like chemotaxis protein
VIKKNILVVENDRTTRKAIEFLFETNGYDVATAATGSEATKRIAEGFKPSLVLIDREVAPAKGLPRSLRLHFKKPVDLGRLYETCSRRLFGE